MGAFIQELWHAGIYKKSQGRITRQLTFAGLAITIALGTWRLSDIMLTNGPALRWGLPGLLLLAGLWISYRIVNVPSFADFLISVEAEMYKVSWPSRAELFRASIVVLLTIFILAAVLASYDVFWKVFFTRIVPIF